MLVRKPSRPRIGRDERLYWWGQTTSALGSTFTAIAMPVIAVIRLHATPGQIGLLSASAVLPVLLLGLPAGALADRIRHPRRTLLFIDTVSALMIATIAAALTRDAVTIGWLAALNFSSGALSILAQVVYFIHLKELVGAEQIGSARGRLQAGQYGAGFVGRFLAGPTIVAFGSAAALSVDAVSYVLSATALLAMRPLPERAAGRAGSKAARKGPAQTARSLLVGLRFFTGDAFHRALMVFILIPVVTMAAAGTLIAPFLIHVVHVPTGAYGAVFALSGLTGLAGSAVASRVLRPQRDPRLVTLTAFMGSAVSSLLLPLASGPIPLAASVAALGISVPVFFGALANVALSPILVSDAGEDSVGRTLAMLQVITALGALLGALLGGTLGDRIGVRPALWTLDLTTVAAMALALPPAVRSARALRQGTDSPQPPVPDREPEAVAG